MTSLIISPDFTLPIEAASQTFLVVGKRGSGKSNTCARLAEQFFHAGVPFVVVDPVDNWWGLKSSRDGKGPGLPVYVFGGGHADLPLEAAGGVLIADKLMAALRPHLEKLSDAELEKGVAEIDRILAGLRTGPPRPVASRATAPAPPRPTSTHRGASAVDSSLPRGERAVLTAIAQHQDGVTREQLTILTGYKRSSRDTYLQRLRERALVGAGTADNLVATPSGVAALGADFEPLPTGDALRAHWMGRLPEGERRVLEIVVQAYPKGIEREQISGATFYKRSSRDTYLQRLGARKLVTAERPSRAPGREGIGEA